MWQFSAVLSQARALAPPPAGSAVSAARAAGGRRLRWGAQMGNSRTRLLRTHFAVSEPVILANGGGTRTFPACGQHFRRGAHVSGAVGQGLVYIAS